MVRFKFIFFGDVDSINKITYRDKRFKIYFDKRICNRIMGSEYVIENLNYKGVFRNYCEIYKLIFFDFYNRYFKRIVEEGRIYYVGDYFLNSNERVNIVIDKFVFNEFSLFKGYISKILSNLLYVYINEDDIRKILNCFLTKDEYFVYSLVKKLNKGVSGEISVSMYKKLYKFGIGIDDYYRIVDVLKDKGLIA